jgi:hypothetical protein
MTQRIIYQNEDGGVSIIIPADCGLTVEEIAAKDVPTGLPYNIVDTTDIPTDRTFRNAWRKQGQAIAEDVTEARVITHEKRRFARDIEMRPLDIQATIPSEEIAAEAARAELRTKYELIQGEIDATDNVDILRAIVVTLEG